MATDMQNDTLPAFTESDLISNVSQANRTVIAQNIMCAYPISDIYAQTPRYLYYSLLFLTFATLRFRWLSNIFLTGAVAYAASAAIHAFIIVSNPSRIQAPSFVSLPYVSSTSNITTFVTSLVTEVSGVFVQPDAVELDIDPIAAVVVTAYLVGLPLQIWSRTMRSSIIIRYMILLWNLCMLAGTICALIAWPTTNLTASQYRFCFAGFQDPNSQGSDGWNAPYWRDDWNSTLWYIFDNPDTIWQQLSTNCFYPCFNTSQIIRQSSALKAVLSTPSVKFAKLHNVQHETNDWVKPLIYAAIIAFSVAQFFLYIVSLLRLGSDAMRASIHEPHRLWRQRDNVRQQLRKDMLRNWLHLQEKFGRWTKPCTRRRVDKDEPAHSANVPGASERHSFVVILRLIIDTLALVILIAGIIVSPLLVVAFICWIEWYIRNDGSTNETSHQVGQWSPVVSIAVVLFAAFMYQFKGKLASTGEIQDEICRTEIHLRRLKGQLEEKNSV